MAGRRWLRLGVRSTAVAVLFLGVFVLFVEQDWGLIERTPAFYLFHAVAVVFVLSAWLAMVGFLVGSVKMATKFVRGLLWKT